jgi:hypothetical protein
MRIWLCRIIVISGFVLAGCARHNTNEPFVQYAPITGPEAAATPVTESTATDTSVADKLIAKPVEALSGKISSANGNLKFVVITFPIGQMAAPNQKLNVYRAGVKVGELVVTGWRRDENIIADIVEGEAQVGDEARD